MTPTLSPAAIAEAQARLERLFAELETEGLDWQAKARASVTLRSIRSAHLALTALSALAAAQHAQASAEVERDRLREALREYDAAVIQIAQIERSLTPEQLANKPFIGIGLDHDDAVERMKAAKDSVVSAARQVLNPQENAHE